ncbi:YopX family protein [Paenibacillus tyrfis]|uniref:YopX family protein n=1 Tax=Paenibacillus tyrfis TaxID=1501230 RepID=UPI0015C5F385|nr:YopX family protein [Paenibacillus tyrfis]
MREIKFQAWDEKLKVMFPVHELRFDKFCETLTYLSGVDIHHKDSDFQGDVFYGGSAQKLTGTPPVRRFKLRQYTGLRDSKRTKEYPNGQEIYDGDVVKAREQSNMATFTGYVHFLNGQYWVNYIGYESYYVPLIQLVNAVYEPIEVIGNIYENPELLQKVEEAKGQ